MTQSTGTSSMQASDIEAVNRLKEAYSRIRAELGKVIVGQDEVVEQLLTCVFARGHCILEGVPGLAKTLLISSLAQCLSLSFRRIQFTPDLMPSDITGTEVIQEDKATGAREFKFLKGPIFANIILADEINRTPPKTQAALLEAMQEQQVTVGGMVYKLDQPFFVLATQNPIEQEGTYPLPEAQQDRFMFKIFVDYPKESEELQIVRNTTPASGRGRVTARRSEAAESSGACGPAEYATPGAPTAQKPDPRFRRKVSGAPDRAPASTDPGGKARASQGRFYVSTEDIERWPTVLRHRFIANFRPRPRGAPPTRRQRLLQRPKLPARLRRRPRDGEAPMGTLGVASLLAGCWMDAAPPEGEGVAVVVADAPVNVPPPAATPAVADAYAPADIAIKSIQTPPNGDMHILFYEHTPSEAETKQWCCRVEVRRTGDGIYLTMLKQTQMLGEKVRKIESNFTHDPVTLDATLLLPNPGNLPVFIEGCGETRKIWP